MTRICMISDTHEQHSQIIGMEQADILLHAGDITYQGAYDKLLEFDEWLDSLDSKFSYKHKVIIPGNHERTFEQDWDTAAAHIPAADAILNGETYEAEGLKIYGEPRQPWFYDWAFNIKRESMNFVWDKVPTDTDVLLTHGPPLGVGDRTSRGEHVGCAEQRKWILAHQPKLVVCGHIHEGYGIYILGRTVVVNASICTSKYAPTNRAVTVDIC